MGNNPFIQNRLNRYFGGSHTTPAQTPYITGYQWVFMIPPKGVPGVDLDSAGMLTALCHSVTIPSASLMKTTIPALGGLKFHIPTSVDVTDTLSLRFTEYTGLPILRLCENWIKTIRDYNWGVARTQAGVIPSLFKSTIYYFTSQPTMPTNDTVEFYAKFTGCFPTRIPTDSFGSDITAVDKLDLDIEFSIDMMYTEPFVKDELSSFIGALSGEPTSAHEVN